MKSFISEDDIEQALLKKLSSAPFYYDLIICDSSLDAKDNPDNGPHRDSVEQCIIPSILKESLTRINPQISEANINETVKNLSKNFADKDIIETNYKLYQKIRETIQVTEKRNGKDEFDFIKLIDFENPENNTFTAVSQLWIKGSYGYRRPNVLIFINGLPIVFIELLNNIRPVIENQQRGAAQPHVYANDINYLRLWIPNEELIEKANDILKPLHKEIYQLQKANRNLAKQRDLLLPRLMSGKLEVK